MLQGYMKHFQWGYNIIQFWKEIKAEDKRL
jgi:hypothetical protein